MVGVNIMRYTIELCKVGIVEAGILRVEQRKRGFFLYLISILVVSITTMVGWDQSLVIFFSILLTLGLSMKTCKKIWLIPTIYVSVSLLDVIHSLVMIRFVGLSYEQMQENLLVSTGINCITLIELFLIYVIIGRKGKLQLQLPPKKHLVLYTVGGGGVALYLVCMQVAFTHENKSVFYDIALISLTCSVIIFFVIEILLFHKTSENELLKREQLMSQQIMKTQAEYYTLMLEKNRQIRAFRHDITNHLTCLGILAQKQKYKDMQDYLADIGYFWKQTEQEIDTGNEMISAILKDLTTQYSDVEFVWRGKIQSTFTMSYYDTCTIFYNVFRNAFEAASQADKKIVEAEARYMKNILYINIQNSFAEEPIMKNGRYESTKEGDEHGFGIENAKAGIIKNGGCYAIKVEDYIFVTEIIIPET